MRLELPARAERFGANLFYQVQKIYELDGGLHMDDEFSSPFHVIQQIPQDKLHEIEQDMAIVIPVKDERLRLLEGVLCGIPHACVPIIVSNSKREHVDRYAMERNMIDTFCRYAKKKYVVAHQRSSELAELFRQGDYPHLLDDDGLVRHGKAEGMLAGIVLARLLGKKYVGFIDADNFFPGSVFEYSSIYAAGFAQSKTPYSMTRIQWHSKPKVVGSDLFFAKWGRVSRITNQYLNMLLSHYTGFETELVRTGNAGEHALSMPLALLLDYTTGFSIETYHFVNMMEKFGGILDCPYPEVLKAGVEIFQVESRNPHLHEATKGNDHIREMIEYSLAALYYSKLCPPNAQKEILQELKRQKIIRKGESPVKANRYPALIDMNFEAASQVADWAKHGNFVPA